MADHGYDQEFLANTIFGLIKDIDDLSKWSVYNDDKFNEEIAELQELIEELNKKINEQ